MKQKNEQSNYDEIRGRETEDYINEFMPIRHRFFENQNEYQYFENSMEKDQN